MGMVFVESQANPTNVLVDIDACVALVVGVFVAFCVGAGAVPPEQEDNTVTAKATAPNIFNCLTNTMGFNKFKPFINLSILFTEK